MSVSRTRPEAGVPEREAANFILVKASQAVCWANYCVMSVGITSHTAEATVRRPSFYIDPKNCFLTDGLNRQTIPGGIQRGGSDRICKRMRKNVAYHKHNVLVFRPSVRNSAKKTSQMISLNLMADEWLRVVLSHRTAPPER